MHDIETIAVIGAGTMGRGIAQTAALAGYRVVLVDAQKQALVEGHASIDRVLKSLVEKGKLETEKRDAALALLTTASTLAEGASDAGLAIEAVPETLELKERVFRELDLAAPRHAILASNTSSLSIAM